MKIKESLIAFLKGAAVKAALKKFLGSAAMGGVKAWLVKFVVTELFDDIAEPVIKAGFVKLGYYYDRINGKILIHKLHEAQDAQTYDSSVDDIFHG